MGIYLNSGPELFRGALRSEIYVDKTGLIGYTNRVLGTEQKYVCVSRPRRFGKSMALNMLNAYYEKGEPSGAMFEGLKAETLESFSEHLNRYNVFRLNMHDFLTESKGDMDEMLAIIEDDLCTEIERQEKGLSLPKRRNTNNYFAAVYSETKTSFIFLIDEWDCIFRVHQNDREAQTKYLDYLRNLLKDKAYIALAYMTGILPIKKYGQHSAINMFTEISILNPRECAEYTGFTESEVEELCVRYNMPFEEVKRWYDGYNLRGISIYNPRSVVMSMTGHDFDNYWTQTETYEALKKYIILNLDGLKDKVTRLVAGEKLPIRTEKFQNDMTSIETADDALTLLIHLGYLTFDFDTKECWIPNQEVAGEFINSIEDGGWEPVVAAIEASRELLSATLEMNEEKVAELIEKAHQDNTSIIKYNDENSLACVLSLAYYYAKKSYIIHRELPTGKGFADLIFIPRYNNPNPAILLELKWNDTAEGAVAQIKDRDYADKASEYVKGYSGKLILAGINYDEKTKRHTCRIETIDYSML